MKYDAEPYLTLYLAIITQAVDDIRTIAKRDDISMRYKRKKIKGIISWLKNGVAWDTLNMRQDYIINKIQEELRSYGI